MSTISEAFPKLDLVQQIATKRRDNDGRIVFTTSFGLEDQAVVGAIFAQNLEIEVVTLDTGRLFPKSYELWTETERRWDRRINAHYPDHQELETLVSRQGMNGFRASVDARHACCSVLMIEPLERALPGAAGGLPGCGQINPSSARIGAASIEPRHQLIKQNPLFD
jgi:phosphoadenosine phosphosulfate reductase